ncbi:MAG: hypothetical protein AAF385_05185 [Pseudomonadota bacterium]
MKNVGYPLLGALLVSLFATHFTAPAQAEGFSGWSCDKQSVISFWEENVGGSELQGKSGLCSTPFGVFSSMSITGLTPGSAYTVWWVYIDKPEECVNFPLTPDNSDLPFPEPIAYGGACGLADFFTPDESGEFLNPLVVFGRMDSAIASNKRRTLFTGDIRNFTPAPGSQVWLFAFGHGPADESDTRQLARQLLTPEDPLSGAPHLGIAGRPFGYPAAVSVFNMP